MAINTSDTTIAIIKEVTAGTTPATPAFKGLDYASHSLNYNSDAITSQTLSSSRASAGSRRLNYRAEGDIAIEFCRGDAIETLLESALSGTWSSDVLKAGKADTSMTVETKMIDDATSYYRRHLGCQVSSFGLSVDQAGISQATFSLLGLSRTTGTSIITGATYTAQPVTEKLAGYDVSSVTVAGVTMVYTSLSLSVSHSREARGKFGSTSADSIGTGGTRSVTLELTGYRSDFGPETTLLADDAPVAVSFTIGNGDGGYTVDLPAAFASVPQDSANGASQLVTIMFTAAYDTTEATDLKITRL